MSIADLVATYQLDTSRAANIAHQGYRFHSLVYAQRCKLHFSYFIREFDDSAFASSREICLQSARKIIQVESQLGTSENCTAIRCRWLGFLMAVFMASIVVLMGLCHNKSSPQREKQRKEIADALRVLEEARHESETAAKFLESLMLVLRKHKILPLKPCVGNEQPLTASSEALVYTTGTTQPYSGSAGTQIPMTPSSILGSNETTRLSMGDEDLINGEDLSSYFNELAQSFEQGIDADFYDWNDIFPGLDPLII
jgi:hypothetical protein